MLNFNTSHRIFLAKAATDMRKSFDTLAIMVREQRGEDPLSGDVFVFVGRSMDRVQVLVWDVAGYWLCAKRLEQGRFGVAGHLGDRSTKGRRQLSAAELHALLEGITIHSASYKKHYSR